MAFDNYQAKKFTSSKTIMVNDNLTVEQPLQICINNEPFTVTMRTPGNDKQLITGLLYSEDIYRNTQHQLLISLSEADNMTVANVTIDKKLLGKGYLNSRNFLSVSSCGICGKKELNELVQHHERIPNYTISHKTLIGMFEQMKKGQHTFLQSGGSHAAAAFNNKGELLSIMEDIGRHNAVDKVIGDLIISGNLQQSVCIVVSGRISYEIVIKAFAAKIGILAAVSAPSTLAVDFAKELGITLLGFCRGDHATCYSHTERIG
ncbi:MAG: formate dehydrogenase accessory sulfurtransferase FdhD [Bacteroidetes bacterium]|nr:formate dehydrogenase accessory sulfurtransferase FdhD [Bacteroidota bacterium]